MWSLPVRLALAAGLIAGGLIWTVRALLALDFPYMLDYGEGAVLQLSALMLQGEPVFRNIHEPPFVACLYAPIHPWLAMLLMGSEPHFWSGRLLSILSTTILLVALWLYLRGRASAEVAVAGVAFFLVHPLVLGWCFRNRIDMIALLASGLALFVASRRPAGWARDLVLATLLTLAFFVKQSYLAAAVAIIGETLLRDWRGGVRLAGLYLGLLGLGLAWMGSIFGNYLLDGMFRYNALPFLPAQMQDYLQGYLASVVPLLLLVALLAWRGGVRREPLWFLFSLASLGMAFGSGRSGGFYNYFLELHLGLSVLGALAAGELLSSGSTRWRGAVQALVLLQIFAVGGHSQLSFMNSPRDYLIHETAVVLRGHYPGYLERSYAAATLRPWLDHNPGPVLAENLGNPIIMGRLPWFCDPVSYALLSARGAFDENALVGRIERREFAVILLQMTWGNLRFSERAIGTILTHYEQVATAGVDMVFLPRGRRR